jgi:hypothetical protein
MPQVNEASSAAGAAVNRINDDFLHIHNVCGPPERPFDHPAIKISLPLKNNNPIIAKTQLLLVSVVLQLFVLCPDAAG